MTRYWIFDREDTPQGLPLSKLVRKIRQIVDLADYRVLVRRSQGYGSTVCRWDDMLDDTDHVSVSLDDLDRLVGGTDEWFYNLDARCEGPRGDIIFGMHDSTALFVEAPAEIAQKIVEEFNDTRVQ